MKYISFLLNLILITAVSYGGTIAGDGTSDVETKNLTAHGKVTLDQPLVLNQNGFIAGTEHDELVGTGNFILGNRTFTDAEGDNNIIIGNDAANGSSAYLDNSIIIGNNAGSDAEGDNVIAIGNYAGVGSQDDNVIFIDSYQSLPEDYDATNNAVFISNGEINLGRAGDNSSEITNRLRGNWEISGLDIDKVVRYDDNTNVVLKGIDSHNLVSNTKGSFVHGNGAYAAGLYSHAEGYLTKTLGEYSHSEGMYTTADGQSSHSEGVQTSAPGKASHAEGYSTIASGQYAHSEGYGTTGDDVTYGSWISSVDYESEPTKYRMQGPREIHVGDIVKCKNGSIYAKVIQVDSSQGLFWLDTTLGELSNDTIVQRYGVAYGTAANAKGRDSVASGDYSEALGVFATSPDYSFTWNGIYRYGHRYYGHASDAGGTFNINPAGEVDGFYIGEKTLRQHITEISGGDGQYVKKSGDTMSGPLINNQAITIGTTPANSTTGTYAFAQGENNQASGDNSYAGGKNSTAQRNNTWVWNATSSPYTAQGNNGTFNINPDGNIDGFYIGSQTLRDHIISVAGQSTSYVKKDGDTMSGALTNSSSLTVGSRLLSETAPGSHSFSHGTDNTAVAIDSYAGGRKAEANDNYSWVWNSSNITYQSHSPGSFNVNPDGGITNFWIGNESLANQFFGKLYDLMSSSSRYSIPASNGNTLIANLNNLWDILDQYTAVTEEEKEDRPRRYNDSAHHVLNLITDKPDPNVQYTGYIFGNSIVNSGTTEPEGHMTFQGLSERPNDKAPPNTTDGCFRFVKNPHGDDTEAGYAESAAKTTWKFDPLANSSHFTIMAWIKRTDDSGSPRTASRIVSDLTKSDGGNGFQLRFQGSDGKLVLNVNDNSYETTSKVIPITGKIDDTESEASWHHIAIIYEGREEIANTYGSAYKSLCEFYRDGVLLERKYKKSTGNPIANDISMYIARAASANTFQSQFIGYMDDIMIFKDWAPLLDPSTGTNNVNSEIEQWMDWDDKNAVIPDVFLPSTWGEMDPDTDLYSAEQVSELINRGTELTLKRQDFDHGVVYGSGDGGNRVSLLMGDIINATTNRPDGSQADNNEIIPVASGYASLAIGSGIIASGDYSFALGSTHTEMLFNGVYQVNDVISINKPNNTGGQAAGTVTKVSNGLIKEISIDSNNKGSGFSVGDIVTIECDRIGTTNQLATVTQITGSGETGGIDGLEIGAWQTQRTEASGMNSMAIGRGCTASGDWSHAEGGFSRASGMYSVAIGDNAIAGPGTSTLAIGRHLQATNNYSMAVGDNCHSYGTNSLAIGRFNTASGPYAVAEGDHTFAEGENSHSAGKYAKAISDYCYVWSGEGGDNDYYVVDNSESDRTGTFNINPVGGPDGFYIGNQNLTELLSSRPSPSSLDIVGDTEDSNKSNYYFDADNIGTNETPFIYNIDMTNGVVQGLKQANSTNIVSVILPAIEDPNSEQSLTIYIDSRNNENEKFMFQTNNISQRCLPIEQPWSEYNENSESVIWKVYWQSPMFDNKWWFSGYDKFTVDVEE